MFDTVSGLAVVTLALSLVAGYRYVGDDGETDRPPDRRADGGYGSPVIGITDHGKPTGLIRWFTTVDHKDIGILYILFGTAAGLWGATDGMMIRAELFTANPTIWDPQTYNA